MDDCRACEGWGHHDKDGFCTMCADEIRNNPWEVVGRDGVRFDGPLPRDAATDVARRASFGSYGSPEYTARRVLA